MMERTLPIIIGVVYRATKESRLTPRGTNRRVFESPKEPPQPESPYSPLGQVSQGKDNARAGRGFW